MMNDAPEPRFARIATMIGDPTRARMLSALLGRDSLSSDGGASRIAEAGHDALQSIGLDSRHIANGRRGVAYPCLDWSERRDHFAGPLAVAMLEHFVARRWFVRIAESRALALTVAGRRSLSAWLALAPD